VGNIIPHENWRGQMARGTFGTGTGRPLGTSSDCASYPPVSCVPVPWPGWNTSAWHEGTARPEMTGTEHYWLGSLAVGMRDTSGQMYMRNRYYDPQTGQFTQTDPIGLAGGMNVYGFAAGDRVSYAGSAWIFGPLLAQAMDCGSGLFGIKKERRPRGCLPTPRVPGRRGRARGRPGT
jgi:RHS repeat-associated protein